tara:strand:+ start:109 stop:471 length:363 start_codon:yes stop_codon:yes gene_type:complete
MSYQQAAEYVTRKAYLSDSFGYDLAVKWFGLEEVAKLPIQEKGKNAGKPLGLVEWVKCVKGGYDPNYAINGKVETRKGWVLGKALLKTQWVYDFYKKKSVPNNQLIKWDGEIAYERWGSF